jgi:hypothetical protein
VLSQGHLKKNGCFAIEVLILKVHLVLEDTVKYFDQATGHFYIFKVLYLYMHN